MNKEFKEFIADFFKIENNFDDLERIQIPAWDSMKHVEFIIKLKEKYKVDFTVKEIIELNKVSDFYKKIFKN